MKKKTSWRDPVVEKIHRFREEYAKKFDYDMEKMYEDLKRLEQEDDGLYVTLEDGKLVPVDPKGQTAWCDPIVEEVRKRGQEYAAQFDFDPHKIGEDLRRQQKESGEPVFSFSGDEGGEDAKTDAFQEYMQACKRQEILELVGKVDYYDDYDPKRFRDRKPR